MNALNSRILKGGIFMLIAQVMQKGFTAIFIVIFSQLLSLRLFGELMLAMTFMNLLAILCVFGLPSSLQKFCSGSNLAEVKKHFNQIASLVIAVSLISATLIFLFHEPIAQFLEPSESFTNLILYASVGVFVQGLFRLCYETLRARENGRAYLIADNLLSILKIVLPITNHFLFGTVSSVLAGVIIAYAITTLWIIKLIHQAELVPKFSSISIPGVSSILGFAMPAWLAGFTYVFAQHVDKLMLGALSRAESVGLYTAASAIAMLLTLFHTAFSSIFSPIAADLNREGKDQELHHEYIWISKWSLFICGLGILLFAGFGDFVLQLFGEQFATSSIYTVLIILSMFYFVSSAFGPTAPVLQMSGSNLLESFNAGAFLIINILANMILIPQYGILGAASATLIAGICRLALQWGQLKFRHGLQTMPLSSLIPMVMVITFTVWAASAPMLSLARMGIAVTGLIVLCVFQIQDLEERERNLIRKLKQEKFNPVILLKRDTTQSS